MFILDIHISASPNAEKALAGLIGSDSGIEFFSLPVELGPDGVKDVHSLGQITDAEKKLFEAAVGELKGSISKVRSACFCLLRDQAVLMWFVGHL